MVTSQDDLSLTLTGRVMALEMLLEASLRRTAATADILSEVDTVLVNTRRAIVGGYGEETPASIAVFDAAGCFLDQLRDRLSDVTQTPAAATSRLRTTPTPGRTPRTSGA